MIKFRFVQKLFSIKDISFRGEKCLHKRLIIKLYKDINIIIASPKKLIIK